MRGFLSILPLCHVFFYLPLAEASTFSWVKGLADVELKNPDLAAARASVEAAHSQLKSAYGVLFPQINAQMAYSESNSATSQAGFLAVNATQVYSASLSVSQNVFNGFQDFSKIEQSRLSLRGAEIQFQSVASKVSYEVRAAFTQLNFAQRSVHLAQNILARRKQNSELVQLRFEGGLENRGSVLLSEAYLHQAGFNLSQAKHQRQLSQQQWAKVTGTTDLNESVELTFTDAVSLTPLPLQQELNRLATENPEYLLALNQEYSANASAQISQAALLPTLSMSGQTAKQGTQWFPQSDRWSVGITFTVPLFSGLRDYQIWRASQFSIQAAQASRSSILDQVKVRLLQGYWSYSETIEKLTVDRAFLDAANARAEIARSKYESGLISFEDWDLIENDLILRERSELQSRKDRDLAEANWRMDAGKSEFTLGQVK